ncbi:MAG: ribosome maturation factor RimP [bacterium]|nr:ribosome maturation factor RimP [bacterium]
MKITEAVDQAVRATVEALGFELDEVEYQKEQGNWVLTLYIDAPEGVTLDDCERVSHAVDPILDEADPIPDAYYLSVSSIGLDRPLKKDRDFARNVGNKLDVKLYAPVNKKKEFLGTLVSFDADSFTIALVEKGGAAGNEMTIARKDAALVRPHIDFA